MYIGYAAIFPVGNMGTVYVVYNKTAVLECIDVLPPFEARSGASISWRKVSEQTLVSGYAPGNNILHIDQAREEDGGEYGCYLLTEHSGTEHADIQLIVISKSCMTWYTATCTL